MYAINKTFIQERGPAKKLLKVAIKILPLSKKVNIYNIYVQCTWEIVVHVVKKPFYRWSIILANQETLWCMKIGIILGNTILHTTIQYTVYIP